MAAPNRIPPFITPQDIQRFWSKVDKTPGHGPDGDCWQWQPRVSGQGYGSLTIRKDSAVRVVLAQRLAYFLRFGQWPADMCVLHKCDNRRCCNPAHLQLGSLAENIADMVAKDRQAKGDRCASRKYPERVARGERGGMAKMTADQVKEMRQLRATGVIYRELAHKFGLCIATTSEICTRKTWAHVPD